MLSACALSIFSGILFFYICFFGTTAVVPKELSHERGRSGKQQKKRFSALLQNAKRTAMHLHSSPLEIIVTDAPP